jgi:hypothetical protein
MGLYAGIDLHSNNNYLAITDDQDKYKKLRGRQQKATRWLRQIAERQPNIFVHWRVLSKNDRTTGAG